MPRRRPSLVAAIEGGWLAGPLLLAAMFSPSVEGWAEQSLVVHHLAHWLMVVGGALLGYRLARIVQLPGRSAIAWLGLGAAILWHLPPLLGWAETTRVTHVFAHATLVAGGIALGWALPASSSAVRAYLFIAANVVMWPLVLAEIAGAFSYAGYQGQASAAGVAELVAMSASWIVLALWSSFRKVFARPAIAVGVQTLIAIAAIAGWW